MDNNAKEINDACKSSSSVTALVPAWQSADFIQDTLDSLSAQTYYNFQVIVSVDLCEDDTFSVCLAHAKNDPRFRVIKQSNRLGYSGNCNFLLDESDSDYVMFAFHDDILAPEYVENLTAVLDARSEVIMSYSDVLLTHVDGQQIHWRFTALEGMQSPLQRGAKMLSTVNMWWVPNRGLFRLDLARKIKGIKTHKEGDFSVDWPWLFHMSLLGEFARIPKTLCYKYYKTNSLSRSWKQTQKQHYEVRASCMRELWNSDLPSKDKAILAGPLTNWLRHTKPEKETKIWQLIRKLKLKIQYYLIARI